jgi:hypothetical protein
MQAGPDNLDEDTIGVNYRALKDLFFLSDQRKDTINYVISVQMLEIYNEQVRDLLAPEGSNKRYPFLIYLYDNIKTILCVCHAELLILFFVDVIFNTYTH